MKWASSRVASASVRLRPTPASRRRLASVPVGLEDITAQLFAAMRSVPAERQWEAGLAQLAASGANLKKLRGEFTMLVWLLIALDESRRVESAVHKLAELVSLRKMWKLPDAEPNR